MSEILVYVDGGAVGDMLILLPGIRGVRAAMPGHRLVWLTQDGASSLGRGLAPVTGGLVDEFLDDSGIGRDWRELAGRPLAGRRFDVVVDLQTRLRTSLILKRIRHRLFLSAAAGYRLSERRPAVTRKPEAVLDHFLLLAELAAGQPVPAQLELTLPEAYRVLARRLLPPGPTYVGVAPGAGDVRKVWPRPCFVALAQAQVAAGRVPVFLLGPDEASWRQALSSAVPEALFPEQADNGALRGPALTMALGERLAVAVANDCGTGHMLGAARRPLVTLFGPTFPAKFRVAGAEPWHPIDARDFGAPSTDRIPVAAVNEAVDTLLARTSTM